MNIKEEKNKKIMDALEPLNLPAEQLDIIESYLLGTSGEEALDNIEFKDLAGIPTHKITEELEKWRAKKKYSEISTLFNITFAIGKSTCYRAVPYVIAAPFSHLFTDKTAYKYISVYANIIATDEYRMKSPTLKELESYDIDLEGLKKAIDCQKGTDYGKLVLLMLYFKRKYTDQYINNTEISELYSSGYSGAPKVDDEDLPLLKEYEDIVVYNIINGLFKEHTALSILNAVKEAVRGGNIEIINQFIKKNTDYTNYTMIMTGGMSYLNFPISQVLKNAVCLCFAIQPRLTLSVLDEVSHSLNISIYAIGGGFDKFFNIDSKMYIIWAAQMNAKKILARQIHTNKELYVDIINNGIGGNSAYSKTTQRGSDGMAAVGNMAEAARENAPELYKKIVASKAQNENNEDMMQLIDRFTSSNKSTLFPPNGVSLSVADKKKLEEYLLGHEKIDVIYPLADALYERYSYGNNEWKLMDGYRKTYGDGGFTRRCTILMLFKRAVNYFRFEMTDGGFTVSDVAPAKVIRLFDDFEKEELSIKYQLSLLDIINEGVYDDKWKQQFNSALKPVFDKYLKEKHDETTEAFSSSSAIGRWFGLTVMEDNAQDNKNEILFYAQDSSKLVKEKLLEILYAQKGWEEDIKKLLLAKKAGEREIGVRVLAHWQDEGADYSEMFSDILQKEKNAKVMALLQNSIKIGGEGVSNVITTEDLVTQLHKGGKKRTLAWAYETPFSVVHTTSGEEAGEEYLQAILLCYSSAEKNGISESAALLAKSLNANELAVYVNELFDKWLEQGAEAKKRWVLFAASIHGGADIVQKLQHQILEWAHNSRGAIASDAAGALALNPLPQALLIVDGISRKYKFRQVKAAAGAALEFAASQLGITREELADRIVPNLGFDENMERIFDYGERKFTVTITTALEVEVFDENGKKLKNLPAVGKKDDPEKAAAAYEEFKQMKKQMKTTVSSQKSRLEFALSVKREWSIEAWNNLFVKNPIMHQFAIGLIWGIYEDGKLTQSFRYMEDGSFNTEDEEEYTLPENGQIGRVRIGLVHPIEMTDVSRLNWKQQLEDYEIKQPIEQLDREVYKPTDEEKEQKSIERFGGYMLNDMSLGGKLLGMGWYRGSVQDAGGFYTYYREDVEAGLGVELHFSGSFVGYGTDEDVTVYDARFYKAGTIERGSYCYDEVDKDKAIALKDIPPRYFSEIVLQLTKATASSHERDVNWKKAGQL